MTRCGSSGDHGSLRVDRTRVRASMISRWERAEFGKQPRRTPRRYPLACDTDAAIRTTHGYAHPGAAPPPRPTPATVARRCDDALRTTGSRSCRECRAAPAPWRPRCRAARSPPRRSARARPRDAGRCIRSPTAGARWVDPFVPIGQRRPQPPVESCPIPRTTVTEPLQGFPDAEICDAHRYWAGKRRSGRLSPPALRSCWRLGRPGATDCRRQDAVILTFSAPVRSNTPHAEVGCIRFACGCPDRP